VNELINQLRKSFSDEEYRNAYAESFMNTYVAAQIKTLREEFPLTQEELARRIGSQQPGIARLENVNYSSWKVETLRKIARALNVRLRISFEGFGTLPAEIEGFNRDGIKRLPFDRDPLFSSQISLPVEEKIARRTRRFSRRRRQPPSEHAAQIVMDFEGQTGGIGQSTSIAALATGTTAARPFSFLSVSKTPIVIMARFDLTQQSNQQQGLGTTGPKYLSDPAMAAIENQISAGVN
jgi:transcriptional regulator with XRE-family HTH domain